MYPERAVKNVCYKIFVHINLQHLDNGKGEPKKLDKTQTIIISDTRGKAQPFLILKLTNNNN